MRVTGGVLLVLLASAGATAATVEGEISRCAALQEDPAARLACYDQLANALVRAHEQDFGTTPKPPSQPKEEDFGKAPKPEPQPEQIETSIVGPFEGWSTQTRFELANGQLWQSAQSFSAFYPGVPDDPKVIIRKGFLGSFWMEVLGGGQTIKLKVRRIK